ncbi:MAG: hypothetical protein KDD23_11715 [Winogradskyella sp.]|nr:hypothetical protein [Winogradskyella sp.]
MKEYLLLFWNESGNGQYQIDPEKMKEGMEAWQTWIGNIAMQGKLISTKPIQWEGIQIGNQTRKESPVIAEKIMVTGYLICKSDNINEVEEWSKTCPILNSPSGFTEIREVAPFEI